MSNVGGFDPTWSLCRGSGLAGIGAGLGRTTVCSNRYHSACNFARHLTLILDECSFGDFKGQELGLTGPRGCALLLQAPLTSRSFRQHIRLPLRQSRHKNRLLT